MMANMLRSGVDGQRLRLGLCTMLRRRVRGLASFGRASLLGSVARKMLSTNNCAFAGVGKPRSTRRSGNGIWRKVVAVIAGVASMSDRCGAIVAPACCGV